MKKMLFTLGILLFGLLCGCSHENTSQLKQVNIPMYEKTEYSFQRIEPEDVDVELTIPLTSDDFETKEYYPDHEGMKASQVYVSAGDIVKAGDVLVSFEAKDLENEIAEINKQLEEEKYLLEHTMKLAEINPDTDYSKDIELINQDIAVSNAYLIEMQAKINNYSIKATDNGVVKSVSDLLAYSEVGPTNMVVSVIYGSGKYYGTTTQQYDFEVGKSYKAEAKAASCDLILDNIEVTTNANGEEEKTLEFSIDESKGYVLDQKEIELVIKKPTIKNAICIPSSSVINVDGEEFVYVLNEKGYKTVKSVKTGEQKGDTILIKEGLNKGDKVVVEQ